MTDLTLRERDGIVDALKSAQQYLFDCEQDAAANLVGALAGEVNQLEGWEGVITLNIRLED